jgi:hypothetical protein
VLKEALIGIVGVLLGVGVNEFIRRRARIEQFSVPIFEKRLGLYEELFRRVQKASEVGENIIASSAMNREQRLQLVSEVLHGIAGYCDEHEMYIRDDLAVHCVTVAMGVEDIPDLPDQREKSDAIARFREKVADAKRMIRKETGVSDIDALFQSITKAKHSSPVIEYYREALKANQKVGKLKEP